MIHHDPAPSFGTLVHPGRRKMASKIRKEERAAREEKAAEKEPLPPWMRGDTIGLPKRPPGGRP